MPFMLGDLVQAVSRVLKRAVSIGRASAQPLAAIACTALVSSLAVCLEPGVLHHLHAIFEDRLQAAILPPFEAQQLAAGLFTPSAPLSATAYRLLPWHLAFRPLYLGFLGTLAWIYLLVSAADVCVAAISKLCTSRVRVPPSASFWLGRPRLRVASVILAFAILVISVAVPLFNIFSALSKLSDEAVGLYERTCSFGNADGIRCQLLHHAATHSAHRTTSSRFLDLYLALRQAIKSAGAVTTGALTSITFLARSCRYAILSFAPVLNPAPVAAPFVLNMMPHLPDECVFCAGRAAPTRVLARST